MKLISVRKGIEELRRLRDRFSAIVTVNYEFRAKPCSVCDTPGICCRDAHFVNVHITRLEAAAIAASLEQLDPQLREQVIERTARTVEKFGLANGGDTFERPYACPLFEPGIGCLVHDTAKPLPCIVHACYENKEDLPPDELLFEFEEKVGALNRRVYGNEHPPAPLPVAVTQATAKPGQGID